METIYTLIAGTVVVIGLILLTIQYYLSKRSALPSMCWASRDSILTGSHKRYFGGGIESLRLVLKESRAQNFKPWVIPGGLIAPDFLVLPSFQTASVVLRRNTDKGGAPSRLYYPGTPKTIVSLDGHQWERRRQLLNSAFQLSNIKAAVSTIDNVAMEAVQVMQKMVKKGAQTIDMYNMCSRVALDIVGCIAFGGAFGAVKDPSNRCHYAAHKLSLISAKNYSNPLRRWLGIGKTEYNETLNILDQAAKDQLEAHSDEQTLVSQIRAATDDEGKIWVDAEDYFEEMRLVVNASHDPALPLSLALYELSRHPEVARKTIEEVDNFFSQRSTETPIIYDDLRGLQFTSAVFRETLRLWPVSGVGSVRKLTENIEIGGQIIPAGIMTVSPFFTIMRSEKEFENPEKFQPERYIDNDDSNLIAKTQLVFSAGPRNCAGFQIALWEGTVVLARLLRNFNFVSKSDLELECGIHIMPKEVNLVVTTR